MPFKMTGCIYIALLDQAVRWNGLIILNFLLMWHEVGGKTIVQTILMGTNG
jgi:hypothetical protein